MGSVSPSTACARAQKQIPPYGPNKAGEKWGAGWIQVKKRFTELSLSMFNLFLSKVNSVLGIKCLWILICNVYR